MTKNGEKTGGRQKNTPNKITREVRERLNVFYNEDWDKALQDWKILTPSERWKYRAAMLKFVAPTMASVDINDLGQDKNNKIVQALLNVVSGNM